MNTESHNITPESGTVSTTSESACEDGSCRTGRCTPCLIVWGLAIGWPIINAVWERLR